MFIAIVVILEVQVRNQIDNIEYYEELGRKLLKIREEKNLVQKEVADAVGVTFQQWQKYEKGVNRIPTKTLVIFCEMTETDIKDITGCTVESYEKIYKEEIINYNTNNTINNIYNYNGFFSNLLNMDLNLMKNKVVVFAVVMNIIMFFLFSILKMFPSLNNIYNHAFLSTQLLVVFIAFTIVMFAVFGYSSLTYITAFIAYSILIHTILRYVEKVYIPLDNFSRLIYYVLAFIITCITFYILKRYKVNLSSGLVIDKKEAE